MEQLLNLRIEKGAEYKGKQISDWSYYGNANELIKFEIIERKGGYGETLYKLSINDILYDPSSNFFKVVYGNGSLYDHRLYMNCCLFSPDPIKYLLDNLPNGTTTTNTQ